MNRFGLASLAAAAALVLAAPAQAATIDLTGTTGWQEFAFGGPGSSWNNDFTFTLSGNAFFRVADSYSAGDQFRVFINGEDKGLTSAPSGVSGYIYGDYDATFADPRFSHAAYLLGPGKYSVNGTTELSPFGGGGAAVQLFALEDVISSAPEPATWAMMLLGFGFVGTAIRARKGSARRRLAAA